MIFPLRVLQEVGQQPLHLLHLGTVPVLVPEDVGCVADHPHAGEVPLEPIELLLGERPPGGERGEAFHVEVVVLVSAGLGLGHRHEEGLGGPARKLALHVLLAPAEHHRRDPSPKLVQVPEAGGLALVVQLVELPVEAEQRSEEIGVEELDDRVDLVDAVLERRAGEHEGVPALELLHRIRGLGLPVLDALGLVEDHDVGPERVEKLVAVRHDLLVVAEREEGMAPVGGEPRGVAAEHDGRGEVGELGDLLLPLGFQRRGRDHEDALDSAQAPQQRAGGDGLDGLPETHVVGKEHALPEREVERSLDLVRQERLFEKVERSAARLEGGLEAGAFAPPSDRRLAGVDPGLERAGEPKALGVGARHARAAHRAPCAKSGADCASAARPPARKRDPRARSLRAPSSAPPGRRVRRRKISMRPLDSGPFRCPASRRRAARLSRRWCRTPSMCLQVPRRLVRWSPAPARIDVGAERTDLHRVAAAARRGDPVVAEGARTPVERTHVGDLGPSAPLPAPDLALVRRDPSPERGRPVIVQAPAAGGGFPSRLVHVGFRGVCQGARSRLRGRSRIMPSVSCAGAKREPRAGRGEGRRRSYSSTASTTIAGLPRRVTR